MILVREAEDGDWPAIYPFFSAIVDAGETYAYPEGLSLEEARAVWMEPAPSQVLVAIDAGGGRGRGGGAGGVARVVGSAKWGPNRPGRGAHVATASFMIDPAFAGHGIGRTLGEEVLARARAGGYRSMQFNAVVETNRGAVHLWQSLGFQVLATVPGAFRHPQHGYVGLHVMFREL